MIQPASSARLTPCEPGLLPGEDMYPCRCRTGQGWKKGTGVPGAHRTGPTLDGPNSAPAPGWAAHWHCHTLSKVEPGPGGAKLSQASVLTLFGEAPPAVLS